MIADQAMSASVTSALTILSFGAFLHSFRLSSNRHWQALRALGPCLPAPAAEPIRSARISDLCALFLGQRRDRIALPLGKCRAGRVPLFSRSPLRVSGTLWDASHLPDLSLSAVPSIVRSHGENHYGSSIKIRNHPIRSRYLSRCQVAI